MDTVPHLLNSHVDKITNRWQGSRKSVKAVPKWKTGVFYCFPVKNCKGAKYMRIRCKLTKYLSNKTINQLNFKSQLSAFWVLIGDHANPSIKNASHVIICRWISESFRSWPCQYAGRLRPPAYIESLEIFKHVNINMTIIIGYIVKAKRKFTSKFPI